MHNHLISPVAWSGLSNMSRPAQRKTEQKLKAKRQLRRDYCRSELPHNPIHVCWGLLGLCVMWSVFSVEALLVISTLIFQAMLLFLKSEIPDFFLFLFIQLKLQSLHQNLHLNTNVSVRWHFEMLNGVCKETRLFSMNVSIQTLWHSPVTPNVLNQRSFFFRSWDICCGHLSLCL